MIDFDAHSRHFVQREPPILENPPAASAAPTQIFGPSMHTNFTKILALSISIVLGGCATDSTNITAPGATIFSGTRHGWISAFYTAETPKAMLPKCLADLAPGELARRHFVKIDYRHARRMLVEVAELPETTDWQAVHIGDHVQLVAEDCDFGKLSRITKFLP